MKLTRSVAVVEIGGITPFPQKGNPTPRVWRLPSQKGLINRYGLNSDGAELVAARLRHRLREYAYDMGYGLDEAAERAVLNGEADVPPGSLVKGKLLAIQVAKNEFTPTRDLEAVKRDYVAGTSLLARYADIIVVNVSCPNEAGYRELQRVEPLMNILTGVVEAAASVDRKRRPAVMVKVSPDEDTEEQVRTICGAVCQSGVDGVIVGNTSTRRPDPIPGSQLSRTEAAIMKQRGGYSGPQLFGRTVSLVKRYRRELDQSLLDQAEQQQQSNTPTRKVIFCSGGITSGSEALEALEAGADVAMVYTGTSLLCADPLIADFDISSCLRWRREGNVDEKRDETGDSKITRVRSIRAIKYATSFHDSTLTARANRNSLRLLRSMLTAFQTPGSMLRR